MGQYVADHEGVVSREVSFEGLLERRDLRAQTPLGQLRQNFRVGGAAKQRLEQIARPEAPSTRVATEESLIPASCKTFSRRWTSWALSLVSASLALAG